MCTALDFGTSVQSYDISDSNQSEVHNKLEQRNPDFEVLQPFSLAVYTHLHHKNVAQTYKILQLHLEWRSYCVNVKVASSSTFKTGDQRALQVGSARAIKTGIRDDTQKYTSVCVQRVILINQQRWIFVCPIN